MPKKTKVSSSWYKSPNWWLFYKGTCFACWYSDSKAQAKEVAKAHIAIVKKRNKLRPANSRYYKKDFILKNTGKGANDA